MLQSLKDYPAIQDSYKVVVAEDDAGLNVLIQKKLKENGFSVVSAKNGLETINLVETNDHIIILLDYLLPDMNGKDIILKLKEKELNVPFVMMTGISDIETVLEMMKLGAKDYLVKDLDFLDLIPLTMQKIATELENERILNRSKENNLLLTRAIEEITTGVIMTDPNQSDNPIVYANPFFYKLTGYSKEEVIGLNCRLLQGEGTDPIALKKIREAIEKVESISIEIKNYSKDGSEFWNELLITPVFNQEHQLIRFIGLQKDITERKRAAEQIETMAYHDFLTGLPNRRKFEKELSDHLINSKGGHNKTAVILLDLDHFKIINDTLGHLAGDTLLKQLAEKVKQNFGGQHSLYRISGDEFCIIMPHVEDKYEARILMEKVLYQIREEIIIDGHEINITASAGLCLSPENGDTVEELLKNADSALYYSKSRGRDQGEIYFSTLNAKSFKHFTLRNDLRKAIDKKQLFIQYMPRVDAQTQQIVGVEALLRWDHPDWGLVSPSEFIPIAEETGMIVPIGNWVLREACLQSKQWIKKGYPPIVLSVNFSVQQLLRNDVLQTIEEILEDTGVSPDHLEIEVTESSFISNEKEVTQVLGELKKRRIKVALDDFGTGYSSLYLLMRLPLDTIKMDKSFVEEILLNPINKSIVISILDLAKSLNMRLVAEGVETPDQYTFLKERRCDEIQGFYFSPPVSPGQFEKLLENKKWQLEMTSEKKDKQENRREHFRISLVNPLIMQMTISMFKGKEVNMGSTEVFVTDIGPGGLRIMMGLKLPVNNDIQLTLTGDILDDTFHFQGNIRWIREIKDGIVFEFGFQFRIDENERIRLTRTLNQLAIKLRNNKPPTKQLFMGDPVKEIVKKHNNTKLIQK
ncbi:EAL domain-containing protein [Aquibacillus halophilus]|uniref:EAL domain-containing protein n=1 Tax=Aquibacillus halophilus TaxID=930132 RepID=A0A6A8D6Z1_9BACI|nr:EAL domain-containing protein [Aquibacillus halophilus]MRH41513.1 EAL domain-containing protein [Aquibacillus halophilus]